MIETSVMKELIISLQFLIHRSRGVHWCSRKKVDSIFGSTQPLVFFLKITPAKIFETESVHRRVNMWAFLLVWLKRNSIIELFQGIFDLKNLVRSLFLVALQPVDCKPANLLKRQFLKISIRTTFRSISMHVIQFPTGL